MKRIYINDNTCTATTTSQETNLHIKQRVQLTRKTYRSTLPAPCSYILGPDSFAAPSTNACFMLAGFKMSCRLLSGMTLTSKHTTPATTGLATLVPDKLLQPVLILDPIISRPYATTSGFTRP